MEAITHEAPTPLQLLVAELSGTGKAQYTGMLFPVPTRLQAHLYGVVEALTHHAGTSRNKMVNDLLEVGIQATMEALPPELAEELHQRSGEILATAFEKNGGLWERGEA
jgi:hypothetical protein